MEARYQLESKKPRDLSQAISHLENNEFVQAEKILAKILRQEPDNHYALIGKIIVLVNLDKSDEALDLINQQHKNGEYKQCFLSAAWAIYNENKDSVGMDEAQKKFTGKALFGMSNTKNLPAKIMVKVFCGDYLFSFIKNIDQWLKEAIEQQCPEAQMQMAVKHEIRGELADRDYYITLSREAGYILADVYFGMIKINEAESDDEKLRAIEEVTAMAERINSQPGLSTYQDEVKAQIAYMKGEKTECFELMNQLIEKEAKEKGDYRPNIFLSALLIQQGSPTWAQVFSLWEAKEEDINSSPFKFIFVLMKILAHQGQKTCDAILQLLRKNTIKNFYKIVNLHAFNLDFIELFLAPETLKQAKKRYKQVPSSQDLSQVTTELLDIVGYFFDESTRAAFHKIVSIVADLEKKEKPQSVQPSKSGFFGKIKHKIKRSSSSKKEHKKKQSTFTINY